MQPRLRSAECTAGRLGIALLLAASGCPTPAAPADEVARRFWEAIDAGRLAEAQELSTAASERSASRI